MYISSKMVAALVVASLAVLFSSGQASAGQVTFVGTVFNLDGTKNLVANNVECQPFKSDDGAIVTTITKNDAFANFAMATILAADIPTNNVIVVKFRKAGATGWSAVFTFTVNPSINQVITIKATVP